MKVNPARARAEAVVRPGASAAVESRRRSRIAEGHLGRAAQRAKQRAEPTHRPGASVGRARTAAAARRSGLKTVGT